MSLTYERLRDYLPPSAIEFVGANQLKLNVTQITGNDDLVTSSSVVDGVAALLEGLVELTQAINAERADATPPQAPIVFAARQLVGSIDHPVYRFTIDLQVDSSSFMDNLIDPTA